MRFHAAMALAGLVGGCAIPLRQVTVTQTRNQNALVMPPEAPMGFGAALPVGATSLALGAALTSAQISKADDVGQQALPLTGLVRGAVGASDHLELTASGSLATPNFDLAPLLPSVDGRRGVLGRGAVGLRMFAGMGKSPMQWAWSVDFGAEATHDIVTDTTTVDVVTRHHAFRTVLDSDEHYALRTLPHARLGTGLRVPLPGGAWAVGGAELQTWPVYWAQRQQVDTCIDYLGGYQECNTQGDIDVAPSKLVAVFSPTLGASIPVGGTLSLQVQGWANLGTEGVQTVPFGGMVMIEHLGL